MKHRLHVWWWYSHCRGAAKLPAVGVQGWLQEVQRQYHQGLLVCINTHCHHQHHLLGQVYQVQNILLRHPLPCQCHLCSPSCLGSFHIGLVSKVVCTQKHVFIRRCNSSLKTLVTCVECCKSMFGRHTGCRRLARRSPARTPATSRPPAAPAGDPRGARVCRGTVTQLATLRICVK